MSHLHRQLAANMAIAADKESTHPCTPTTVADSSPAPPPAARAPRKATKRTKARRRG